MLARSLDLLRSFPEPRSPGAAPPGPLRAHRTRRAELDLWEGVSRLLHVPFHVGVISQFEGYGELAELDWDGYRDRYGDIRRLDRILEAEG